VALRWTVAAYADLQRIHEFLEPVNPSAAFRAVRLVVARVRRIPAQPRLGERLPGFADREVRRVLVRSYEIRYEVSGGNLIVLRIFHVREDR
jgi:plasmid stabilization system protein ParE